MSTLDLSDVVGDLATGTYTVTRTLPGTFGTDGRFLGGTPSTLTIQASVQPLNGRELLRLPEGLRTLETRKVYSVARLFTQGAGQDPDVIAIDGTLYECQTSEPWGADGNYFKAIVASIGRAAP